MKKIYLLIIIFTWFPISAFSQMSTILEIADISLDSNESQRLIGLPFGFLATSTGLALGAGVIARGYGQKQLSMVGAGYSSENDSSGFSGGIYNYKLKSISPLISFDIQNFQTTTTNDQLYFSFDKDDNSNSEILQGASSTNDFSFRMNYNFKTRNKFKKEIPKIDDGHMVDSFIINPVRNGDLIGSLSYFYNEMTFEKKDGESHKGLSDGLIFGFEYDNRNHKGSPSIGNRIRTSYTKDFGNKYNGKYDKFEIDLAQYFSIDKFAKKFFEQAVVATNMYYSNVFSQDDDDLPAWFARSSLGGQQRLRGYNASRFVGRTAGYASAELRFMSNTKLLKKIKYVNLLDIPWWQLIGFAEIGNTSETAYVEEFFKAPHLSYGAGVAFFIEGIICRSDFAVGAESSYLRIRVNQPF